MIFIPLIFTVACILFCEVGHRRGWGKCCDDEQCRARSEVGH